MTVGEWSVLLKQMARQQESSFTFPRDLQPMPGNLSTSTLNHYLRDLSAGPRLTNLQDTQTIYESSLGHNITITHLRPLLHLSEILPSKSFAVFLLLGGSNWFNMLNTFDLAYPGYYEEYVNNTNNITTISLIFSIMAICIAVFFLYKAQSIFISNYQKCVNQLLPQDTVSRTAQCPLFVHWTYKGPATLRCLGTC